MQDDDETQARKGWPESEPGAPDERVPRRGRGGRGNGFALFAEVLLVGAFILVTSIPVVTVPASFAAGTAHLRRHVAGVDDGVGTLFRDWWRALRELWVLGLVVLLVGAFVGVDLVALGSGALPGGELVRLLLFLAAGAFCVVLLRGLGSWSSGTWSSSDAAWSGGPLADTGLGPVRRATRALRVGTTAASDDLGGSVLLLVAVAASAVFVWMLAPVAIAVGGLVCFATLAVAARPRAAGV